MQNCLRIYFAQNISLQLVFRKELEGSLYELIIDYPEKH